MTVIVVGSANVDLVMTVPRLPRPGESVVGSSFVRTAGGKGANQATAASRLGARAALVGCIGDDELGTELARTLETEGVDLAHTTRAARHTGVAQIVVDAAGENAIAFAPGANDELTPTHVAAAVEALDGPAVVLANLEVPMAAVAAAARAAADRGWPFVLNPAPAAPVPVDVLAMCAYVVANEVESADLGGPSALLGAGAGAVVVTRGAQGADLHDGAVTVHTAAFPVEAVDTTGAGDTFCGAFAVALTERRAVGDAVGFACAAGALATRALGATASMPSRDEVDGLVAAATA